jgi:hypothetical protein
MGAIWPICKAILAVSTSGASLPECEIRVMTRGKSLVRQFRSQGSVRGVSGNRYFYRDRLYTNHRVRTNISRTCRGTPADTQTAVEFCRNAPHTTKRVAIVTSSLSKAAVRQAFLDIAAGAPVDPYFVQLYWLLSSFFAACTEVGAFGCVICQE